MVIVTELAFMKIPFFVVAVLISCLSVRGQDKPVKGDEKVIFDFLSYVACKDWSKPTPKTSSYLDTLIERHLIFDMNDTINRNKRIIFLLEELQRLSKQVRLVKQTNLMILPYDEAPDSLQIIKLPPSYMDRSFVVIDRNNSFRRYILLQNGKVEAFVLWGKTAFAKLN